MSVFQGTNEIDNVLQGTNEIQAIYQGSQEIWTNAKAIDLGTAQTFNIRTLLPNVDYTQLTTNNFVIVTSSTLSHGSTPVYYEGQRTYVNESCTKSYNSSTGVLTCRLNWNYLASGNVDTTDYASCHVYYVKDISKLISLGAGTSFNIRTLYPNLYQSLTVDNFAMITINNASDSARSSGSRVSASVTFTKSYNSSTGVFTFSCDASYTPTNCYIVKKVKQR